MNTSVVMPLDSRGSPPAFPGPPERTGEGATSVVYRAAGRVGRTVAIKEPRAEPAGDSPAAGVCRDPAGRPCAAWPARRLAGPVPDMDVMPCSA